jgi:hypothetical protein
MKFVIIQIIIRKYLGNNLKNTIERVIYKKKCKPPKIRR